MDQNSKSASNDALKSTSPNGLRPSISSAAEDILLALTKNPDLEMPAAVTNYASAVIFTPDDAATFLPTPLKMTESASALWACIGLFANAISQERYGSPEPTKIVVDVYSATLMLCSVFLFQVDGKPFVESKVVPRAIHLDTGNNRETYRNVVSNMYDRGNDGEKTTSLIGFPGSRPRTTATSTYTEVSTQHPLCKCWTCPNIAPTSKATSTSRPSKRFTPPKWPSETV
jgi:hypothetical protein